MMTTGYDCPDILNLGLFRPIFSPTDFIQIKGRGTRKHDFREQLFDETIREGVKEPQKTGFKLFDFFANCEYFEEKFDYDQIIKLPKSKSGTEEAGGAPGGGGSTGAIYEHLDDDILLSFKEEDIGRGGMRIDREFYAKFEDVVRENAFVAASVEAGEWDRVIDYLNRELFDKPSEYYSLEKLRKAAGVDRRLTLREILEKIFGLIPRFKSKDELLEEEFSKFVADYKPDEAAAIPAIKNYFKAYAASDQIRHIIETGHLTDLATNPIFSTREFKAVPAKYRKLIPEYVKDYVSLNQFAT
jgi:type I restriction enzyme R subunit